MTSQHEQAADTAGSLPPIPHPETPYQSLYRRYRPQRFSEVRGQGHVTLALRNAVREGRVTHAYLFSGPRGTGKTSTARILAKALNCLVQLDGEPCGECESCRSIAAGSSFDVHELDAASSNGVDAMRDLVARASLATPGRFKVYIVDEVHMLSTAASNALLKTLEEPPEHVAFVLATTDPQKVLPTIRSRTQHYEFHLLGDDVLDQLLEDVASDAGLALPGGALDMARRRAKGSARDALSVLDRVAAGGIVDDDSDHVEQLVVALADQDLPGVFAALERALVVGRDPQQVTVEVIDRLRIAFLALVDPPTRDGGGARRIPTGNGQAKPGGIPGLGMARVVRAMETLGTAIVSMRDAPEPRITLEVALARCTRHDLDTSPEALLERLERLERLATSPPAAVPAAAVPAAAVPALEPVTEPAPAPGQARAGIDRARADIERARAGTDGPTGAGGAPPQGGGRPSLGAYRRSAKPPAAREAPPEAPHDAPVGPPADTRATDGPLNPLEAQQAAGPTAPAGALPSRDALVQAWGDGVLAGLRPRVKALYSGGHFVAVEAGAAVFTFPNSAHVAHAEPHRAEVSAALSSKFGIDVPLTLVVERPAGDRADSDGPSSETGARSPGPGGTPAGADGRGTRASLTGPADDLEDDLAYDPTEGDGPGDPGHRGDAPSGLTWAEERVLRAFPGAEEV